MAVTFTARRISSHVDDYRCNETGVHYQIRRTTKGYAISNSGVVVAFRNQREDAMTYIQQQAELDFRTAQADSAFTRSY